MTTTGTAATDARRARLHGMWASVAPGWAEHAGYADARGAGIARAMLAATAPRPGERVLELACGPGGLGLAAAPLVAPGGEVVMSDVAGPMVDVAAARVAAAGLTGVSTRTLDMERIDEPDASYDVVLCREGLMFALDPRGAVGEIARVLGPGGRVAVAVWGPRERNPWLGLVLDAVSARIGRPTPPPGVPGPFSLADGAALAGLLAGVGLRDVHVEEVDAPLLAASADEWWTRTTALAGPLAGIVASLPQGGAAALRDAAREAAAPYETASGPEFPGLSLVAAARRPTGRGRPAR